MALTFGTLLSSQGADAQRTGPSRAFVPGGLSYSTPCMARCHTRGSDLAAPGACDPVSLGAKKKLRGRSGGVKPAGSPERVIGDFRTGFGANPQVVALPCLRRCEPAHGATAPCGGSPGPAVTRSQAQ